MPVSRRRVLRYSSVGLASGLAGCSGILSDASTEAPTEASTHPPTADPTQNSNSTDSGESTTYQRDAVAELMTGSHLQGDVAVVDETRDQVGASGVIASHARTFSREGSNDLTVVVAVFESVDDAETYLSTRRTEAESRDEADVSELDLGDGAHAIIAGSTVAVDTRLSNVAVTVFGQTSLSGIRSVAEGQLQLIRQGN